MADLKAVIYARYSSSSQREESIEAQLNVCNAYAERNGYVVIGSYADRAKTGTNDNRPELQRMIRDSKRKQFDVVLVYKLDRFARNRFDSATNKAKLKENGVRLVSATESFGDGDESIIIESVLEGYAEYYSKKLKERVIDGLNVNASKLLWNGGTVPIGYMVNEEQRLEKDPMTAPYVVEAFRKYDEGYTLTEIRDHLNNKGITNTRGTAITYGTIQHMLSNRRYIGEYSFRDVIVSDGIPAIVSQDLFDRVQEKLAKNKKAPARAKADEAYLLATKIYCGHCGTSMNGESGKSRNGTIHRYYKCHAVKKKLNDCKKKSVKKEWIEDLVVKETMSMLMDDNAIEAIVSMLMRLQDEENTDLPMYEKQLKQTQVEIANIMAIFKRGAYSDSLQEELLKLEAQKKEIQIRIEEEKLEKPKIPEDFMRFWLHRFRKLDVTKESHRQMLIDTFVNRIYVFDDKLLLTFNYKDGTRTITLTDAKIAVEKNVGSNLDCSLAPKISRPHWGRDIFNVADSNRFRCDMPVAYRCHQFKNWWQHLCSPIPGRTCKSSPATGTKKTTNPYGFVVFLLSEGSRTRTDSDAICRWHIAATSSKTGGNIYIRPFPGEYANRVRPPAPKISRPHWGRDIFNVADTNRFRCDMPVAYRGHQFKNWWQHLCSSIPGRTCKSSPATITSRFSSNV